VQFDLVFGEFDYFQLQLKISSSQFRNKTIDKEHSFKSIYFHKCSTKDAKFGDCAQVHAYILKKINVVRIFKYIHRNKFSNLKIFTNFQSDLFVNKVKGKF
jgi:hypothetical protein